MNPISRIVRSIGGGLAAVLVASLIVSPTQGGGGVTGTGYVAFGEVTDFGSVFVNGIEFFTQNANVIVDGVSNRSEGELRIGMPVRVAGVLNPGGRTGIASTVEYAADLRGIVDGPATKSGGGGWVFYIHGLAVRVNEFTVFEALAGPGSIAAGDRIEASGLRDDETGEIHATFVSRGALSAGTVVSGVISDVEGSRFKLGSLTVSYDDALGDALPEELENGMLVWVKSNSAPVARNLEAAELRIVSGSLAAVPGTEASAEGIVTLRTATGFSLSGLAVLVNEDTQYRDGSAAQLVDGAFVKVEGTVQVGGALLATDITLPRLKAASAEAVIFAKDANGFQLDSANGVRVIVSTSTRFHDRGARHVSDFGFASLRVGDTVSVTGKEMAEGTIIAKKVSRIDSTGIVALRAQPRATVNSNVVLLSMSAVTDASTEFRDAKGKAITGEAFFAKAAGRRVHARGPSIGANSIRATVLEIDS